MTFINNNRNSVVYSRVLKQNDFGSPFRPQPTQGKTSDMRCRKTQEVGVFSVPFPKQPLEENVIEQNESQEDNMAPKNLELTQECKEQIPGNYYGLIPFS